MFLSNFLLNCIKIAKSLGNIYLRAVKLYFWCPKQMNNNYLITLFLFFTMISRGQVGIGTTSPAASAVLDIQSSSNDKGIYSTPDDSQDKSNSIPATAIINCISSATTVVLDLKSISVGIGITNNTYVLIEEL